MSKSSLQRAVSQFQTQAAFAAAVGVKSPSVSEWMRRGVPLERCREVEAATSGAVRCEDLRPDVDWTRDDQGRVTGYHVRIDPPAMPVERVA